MKARMPKIIPLKIPEKSLVASGFRFSGLNAWRSRLPRFESSIQIASAAKMVISITPRTTPALVESRTSR
jgi:hypothetical protein